MKHLFSQSLDLLLLATIVFYLCLSPFTKVEESFNIQAISDLIEYGPDELEYFDHIEFPGAVKRSFLGAVILSSIIRPLKAFIGKYTDSILNIVNSPSLTIIYTITDLRYQFVSRILLGLFNGLALINLKSSIVKACDKNTDSIGLWFSMLQYSQFHVVYYASRTLPNFFALPLFNLAIANIITGDIGKGLAVLVFTGIVFRVELLFFAGIILAVCLYNKQTTISKCVLKLFLGAGIGIFSSFFVDSYFWKTPSLPELESFIYNVIQGESKNWGTEPIYYYFTKYFMKLFTIPLVPILAIPGLFIDMVNYKVKTMQSISISSLLFVCLMSLQPHKEWRFIIYSVPGLTMSAASAVSKFTLTKSTKSSLISLLMTTTYFANVSISLLFAYSSSFNYPGGKALETINLRIYDLKDSNPFKESITIHMDIPTCMTGATLFGQISSDELKAIYDKTEDLEKLSENNYSLWYSFDYVLTEFNQDSGMSDDEKLPSLEGCEWLKIDVIEGFSGLNKGSAIEIVKDFTSDPINFLNNILQSFKYLDFSYLKKRLRDIVHLEPKLYIYEKTCA